MKMIIRSEVEADRPAVQDLIETAFARAGRTGKPTVEAVLNDELRRDPDWISTLTLVAEVDGEIVGQATSSYGLLLDPTGGRRRLVGVGPVSVLPRHQGVGVGSAILRSLIATADLAGEPALLLLGAPEFYGRFGFVASSDVRIKPPDPAWGKYFQVLPLAAFDASMVGRFRYAAPFDML
jgi:putative acetyltransferase